jgi:hypothetical protein
MTPCRRNPGGYLISIKSDRGLRSHLQSGRPPLRRSPRLKEAKRHEECWNLGIALIAVALGAGLPFFADPIFMYGAVAVGGVLILTALVRICPLYSLLGIRT